MHISPLSPLQLVPIQGDTSFMKADLHGAGFQLVRIGYQPTVLANEGIPPCQRSVRTQSVEETLIAH